MEYSETYLTYQEYMTMGGTLDIMPFHLLSFEASRRIDERTQERLKNATVIPLEVKMCMFRIIEDLQNYSEQISNTSKGIASENIDGYSVSYMTGSQIKEAMNIKNKEIDDTIDTYLYGVIVNNEHILYLGVK